jgi:glycosyltransferase involved in cell wall biosynthesis
MTSPGPETSPTSSPRRVLACIKGLGNGGAEQLVVAGVRFRDPSAVKYSVAYLLPWKTALVESLTSEGTTVTCLGARGSWDLRWLARLRAQLRSERVDVVHSHSPLVAAGVRLVVRTLPRDARPVVVTTEHNVWSSHNRLTRLANAATVRLDDVTVAVSGAVRDSMPERARTRTRVVRYGVDVDAVLTAASGARDDVRAELGLSPDDVVVGTVANMRRTKAYPDLLAAASIVIDDLPNVRFVAVGQGPLESELRALHAELGLGDRFVFTGYRADATRVMSAFDIFCLASHYEGLPIAMLEALTIGMPVIATDVGGVSEVFDDDGDALLVPPGRPDQLAKAIGGLAADPDARAAMSSAARRRRSDFSVERAVHEMEAIYAEGRGR